MRAKKRLGQHFLKDEQVLSRLLQVIAPSNNEVVVEIGPGLGALTAMVLPHCQALLAIEIDTDVLASLRVRCQGKGDLTVLHQDALTVDFSALFPHSDTYRLIGNLPYNISTPLIFHVLQSATRIKDMYFMLQKEVAARMAALPGDKTYGRLSVMVQYAADVLILFDVGPQAFSPPPKVDSAIVKLMPYRQKPIQAQDEQHFATLVTQAFSQRRKMLRASLKSHYTAKQLQQAPVDLMLRPEQLSVADFVRLSDYLLSSQ